MSDRTKLLFDQIQALTAEERLELLGALEDAVYSDDPPPGQYESEEAFLEEIGRRSDSYHDGTAELRDSADVFRDIEERIRRESGS